MSFTNEDLERMKECLKIGLPMKLSVEQIQAILSRLEAAERCVEVMKECSECNSWNASLAALKDWRKACGG